MAQCHMDHLSRVGWCVGGVEGDSTLNRAFKWKLFRLNGDQRA